MPFHLEDLDPRSRSYMLDELRRDVDADGLYCNPALTATGRRDWPNLLRRSLSAGSPDDLADQLRQHGRIEGSANHAAVAIDGSPTDAAALLADEAFNRFYCRGACRRALDDQHSDVEVVQATDTCLVDASRHLVGLRVDARWLLSDLRLRPADSIGKVPGGANSGLSVRVPRYPSAPPGSPAA